MLTYYNPLTMYQKNASNLPYPTSHSWYPNHGPSHHPNNQYLGNPTATSGGTPLSSAGSFSSNLDNETAAAQNMYYQHHPMFHQPSPDWSGHDNFAIAAQNQSLLQSAMGPSPAALHMSQNLNGGINNSNTNGENLSSQMQNIPPSPPITVNSGCSEMSSPGITNSGGSGIGNGSTSPHLGNGNNNTPRPKSPYEWMKKTSYQSQPTPGKQNKLSNKNTVFILFSLTNEHL